MAPAARLPALPDHSRTSLWQRLRAARQRHILEPGRGGSVRFRVSSRVNPHGLVRDHQQHRTGLTPIDSTSPLGRRPPAGSPQSVRGPSALRSSRSSRRRGFAGRPGTRPAVGRPARGSPRRGRFRPAPTLAVRDCRDSGPQARWSGNRAEFITAVEAGMSRQTSAKKSIALAMMRPRRRSPPDRRLVRAKRSSRTRAKVQGRYDCRPLRMSTPSGTGGAAGPAPSGLQGEQRHLGPLLRSVTALPGSQPASTQWRSKVRSSATSRSSTLSSSWLSPGSRRSRSPRSSG